MTIEEFIARYSESPFELIDGQIEQIAFPAAGESSLDDVPTLGLHEYIESRGLGRAFMETPFIVPDPELPDQVLCACVPEAMFYQFDRFEEYQHAFPEWESSPLMLVPDLVVRVVDHTDPFTAVSRRILNYLDIGVQMVWLIETDRRDVLVCEPGRGGRGLWIRYHGGNDIVDCGDVLPGFEIPVAQLFEGQDD